jgi:hypothetical protein
MANLITDKQKKIINRDYLIRLWTIYFLIFSLLGIFFLAYVIPYFFSVSKKDLLVAERFQPVINVENKENIGASANRIVNQTLDEMKAVEIYSQNTLTPSVYLNKVIASQNREIHLTRLSFIQKEKGQGQISVGGQADSREGLVAFIDSLKSQNSFVAVESPISDFAKDSDLFFSLNIKIAI